MKQLAYNFDTQEKKKIDTKDSLNRIKNILVISLGGKKTTPAEFSLGAVSYMTEGCVTPSRKGCDALKSSLVCFHFYPI